MTKAQRLLHQRPCKPYHSSALERYANSKDHDSIDNYIMQKQEFSEKENGKIIIDKQDYDAFVAQMANDLDNTLNSIK